MACVVHGSRRIARGDRTYVYVYDYEKKNGSLCFELE